MRPEIPNPQSRTGGLVSVCVPTYNGARYLDECLASASAQTYANIEILVVDDGSSDDTIAIAEQWQQRDQRVRIERNRSNLGLVHNWNRCIQLARGEWIKFLFQDDTLEPVCVETLLDHTDNKWKIIACDRRIIFDDVSATAKDQWLNGDFNIHLARSSSGSLQLTPSDVASLALDYHNMNFVGEPTVTLCHRSVFETVGAFNPDLVQLCDIEFWLRAGLAMGIRYVDETLATFRIHPTSATSKNANGDPFRAGALDPLVLWHECLYSPYFKYWRLAAQDRHALRRSRLGFRYQTLRAHTRVQLDLLRSDAPQVSKQHADAWEALILRYPRIINRTHMLVPLAARIARHTRGWDR